MVQFALEPSVSPVVVLGVALLVGVGIDVDHFALARLNRGDWTALRRCVREPRIVLFDQDAIFDEGDVGAGRRLLSHTLVGGVAVVALQAVDPALAIVAGVVLGVHLAMDFVGDWLLTPGDPDGVTNA